MAVFCETSDFDFPESDLQYFSEWGESIDFESIDDQAEEPAAKRPRTGVESHGRRQHDLQGELTLFVFFFWLGFSFSSVATYVARKYYNE